MQNHTRAKPAFLAFFLFTFLVFSVKNASGRQSGIQMCDSEFLQHESDTCRSKVTLSAPLQVAFSGYSGSYWALTSNGYVEHGVSEDGTAVYFHGDNACLSGMTTDEVNVTVCESTCYLNGTVGKGDPSCVPKCCPMGQLLDLDTGDCIRLRGDHWRDKDDEFKRVIRNPMAGNPNLFYDPDYLMCRRVPQAFRIRTYTKEDMEAIIANPAVWRSRQRFCVDIFHEHDGKDDHVAAIFMCLLDREDGWKDYRLSHAVTEVFMVLTIAFHIAILVVHGILWDHQGCYGWTIMAFCGSQLTFYCSGLVVWTVLRFVENCTWSLLSICGVAVIIVHFSFLATYTWTLLLAYEVWRKVSAASTKDVDTDWERFRVYALIGFGIPLPIVIGAICTFFPQNPLAELPDLCKHYVETISVYFAIIPTLILYSCISVFGFLTLKRLWDASKTREALKAGGTSVGKPFYRRVALIWKLMALMGTFLILDILFEAWDSSKRYNGHSLRFPLQTCYKMFHAFAQFWIFVCSGRTRIQLCRRFPELERIWGFCSRRNAQEHVEEESAERLRRTVGTSSSQDAVA